MFENVFAENELHSLWEDCLDCTIVEVLHVRLKQTAYNNFHVDPES
jgi:hypothetical protein